MKNIDYKLRVVKENFTGVEGNITLREYVENERKSAPGFMSWLLSDNDLSDFGSNMTADQEAEYQNFLSNL
jgi:hypothetical protein